MSTISPTEPTIDPAPEDLADLARLKTAGFACRVGTTALGAPATVWYHADTSQLGTVEELAAVLGVLGKPYWAVPRLLRVGEIELAEQSRLTSEHEKHLVAQVDLTAVDFRYNKTP